jgi:hypothetical protein
VQGEGGAAAAWPRRFRHGAAGVPLLQGAPRPGRLRKGRSPGWRASLRGLRQRAERSSILAPAQRTSTPSAGPAPAECGCCARAYGGAAAVTSSAATATAS